MTKQLSEANALRDGQAPVGVALVGCGYWGPNLIRNFAGCPGAKLVAVCDRDPARLRRVAPLCPGARLLADLNEALQDDAVEAVVVATPPETHGLLARAALLAGKHVLVEKPLATSVQEAAELVHLAEQRGRTLMVDHTFLYSPAVRKIKELIASGALGEIWYVDSVRINLGLFQSDVNVLWDLATHDLAIVDHLLGRMPVSLSAFGSSHTGNDLEDVAYLNLDFGGGLLASFHVNWLSPVKVRHLIIGGSKKGLIYNDLDPSEPIKVYDRGITLSQEPDARRGVLINYRVGDVWSPQVEKEEPLQNMAAHFAECIRSGARPRSDGQAGLRVVRILDLAQRSLNAQGSRLAFHYAPKMAA
jgi:predicted dehydrogenase